jgi:hypothetical protein
MFDIFYLGKKPGLFAHERAADSIAHAQELSRTRYFWWINYLADLNTWDWLYEPTPWQAHYRHAWPSQHQKDAGVYLVPKNWNGSETNYRTDPVIQRKPDLIGWKIPANIDTSSFDFSWHPDYTDPSFEYNFGTQWQQAGGPVYGSGPVKIMDMPRAVALPGHVMWTCPPEVDVNIFDFSWHPDPFDPPYVYEFATTWQEEGGPIYTTPGAVERKYIQHIKAKLIPARTDHWELHESCSMDFSWRPHPKDPPYTYVFGNQHWSAEIMPTVTYTVPGATERKYMDYPCAQLLETHLHWDNITHHNYEFDYSWQPDPGEPPMIYVFGNQHWPAEKMPMLRYCSEPADQGLPVKYMDYPRALLSPNKEMWVLPEGVHEEHVDFSWVPDPGEPPYIYQFATQWQKTGGAQYHVPGATETKYLEHVEIKIETVTVPIVEIDHLDGGAGNIPNTIKRIRYFDNYRDTLVRLAKSLVDKHEFVWVCSSICDYTDFDFSWHPEKWQSTMLHVFASNEQKFGDTFYMHVPTFAARAEKKALLEWYSVNYVPRIRVPRKPMPVIKHTEDSHADTVKTATWTGPLATFTNTDYVPDNTITVPLWRAETKTIVPLSPGATSVIVPRVAVGDIHTQLYDYPYIDRTHRKLKDQPLDIVFISNGENEAEHLYRRLTDTVDTNYRIKRVQNVNGRVAAYQAAAKMSTTPWFFAVFAKLEVNKDFDWSWQPDRMQQPKHYIFHARNPVNGLEYGHQAMIAYNKQLVLTNTGIGLDFTLDQAHEVVPIMSGTANYTESPWMAWRTAFREVLKLKHSLPDVESEYRLRMWLSNAGEVPNAKWSQWGAEDAVEYYNEVNGDFTALKKSYEWDWLATYAFIKRSLVIN